MLQRGASLSRCAYQPGARVLHRRRPEPTVPALRGTTLATPLVFYSDSIATACTHAFRVGGWVSIELRMRTMNEDTIKGNWKQFKGNLKEQWAS